MATENTHWASKAGAGGTLAAVTNIGQLTLPAGGPWLLHHVGALAARATATPAEAVTGRIQLVSVSGDMDPNPAPLELPLNESSSFLNVTTPVSVCPLHLYEVNYEAAGKAIVDLNYISDVAITVAPKIVIALGFGKTRPEKTPIVFSDSVTALINTAADISIGTITLSERAKKITGVACFAIQDGVLTTAEELIGTCRLTSDDVDLTPFSFPMSVAFGAGLGATIGGGSGIIPTIIPVDIPVTGGARISAFADLVTAVTNTAEVAFYITYE